ncbi:hypothetical protein LLG95_05050 [bacterium]|nr:hypothetical protein [bacterium]
MMSDAMYEVGREHYTTVIRDMLKHENDVTNHRIMWLLIGQGFIANAFIFGWREEAVHKYAIAFLGILVTIPAFVMLYESYLARGYLQFLGRQAKQGALPEEHLPLVGWPRDRIEGWWRDAWMCHWLARAGDVLEPWLFLPSLFMTMWMYVLLTQWIPLNTGATLALAVFLTAALLSLSCLVVFWTQGENVLKAADDANRGQ